MKRKIGFIILAISFAIFVLLYLKYDSKGYNYGCGCIFCDKKLPYNLEPKFYTDYPQRFYLLDEDKFELIGIGFKFHSNSFEIKNFIAYGYNDTSVIVKCTDSLNSIKYLISYKTGYKSKKGNIAISFKDINNYDFNQIKDLYKWFDIDEEKVNTIKFMKFVFMIGAILSLLFLAGKVVSDFQQNRKSPR